MDHYQDIQLLPDPEFGAPQLMSVLFAKLHRALVQSAPTSPRRQAWQARVETLAASLADEPALRERFLLRWGALPA